MRKTAFKKLKEYCLYHISIVLESLEDTSIITLDKPSQTTPGLAKNGPPDISSLAKAESAPSDDEVSPSVNPPDL